MFESTHGMWSSRLLFILAASGSAVGLGNIWSFLMSRGEMVVEPLLLSTWSASS